eukprot:2526710-Prymnesium_polylepis.1
MAIRLGSPSACQLPSPSLTVCRASPGRDPFGRARLVHAKPGEHEREREAVAPEEALRPAADERRAQHPARAR